ncbi:hypothetical protein CEXT_378251 [Caerostris extrusa]|uniref:Uncharacterized protein n=1 Tax=Caerostris extrusa TaxID=172846 RepID=A0AAV4PT06_CAEEX|nr:hypothetical protein CEXT_378251 [Caerostris extrusa]
MFMQKVFNWIIPLERTETHLDDEEEINSPDSEEITESYKYDRESSPSLGTVTSILDLERNLDNRNCTPESTEFAGHIQTDDKNWNLWIVRNLMLLLIQL